MAKDFVLRFSVAGLRRLAAGAKRATVVRATQSGALKPGRMVTATALGVEVRVPLRVEQLHRIPGLAALPALARRVGLEVADFTTLADWVSYQRAAARGVPGPAAVVVFASAGPVVGTFPDKAIRPRQVGEPRPPDALGG